MSLPLPQSLTPSKVSAFKDCALAFRFSAIDHLPEPPSPPAVKGTLVHRALEGLYWSVPPGQRTLEAGHAQLALAWDDMREDPEWLALGLDEEGAGAMLADAGRLVDRYFAMEDPETVRAIGTELVVEATIGSLLLRGIIDRLDLDAGGRLVVTDYKTGKVPGAAQEQARLGGVHFYAYLCERALGVRPAEVRLLYLRDQVVISTVPSEQSTRGLVMRTRALWSAVERACRLEDFRPKPSALCDWCAFRAWCPAFGGDPALARAEAEAGLGPGFGGDPAMAQAALHPGAAGESPPLPGLGCAPLPAGGASVGAGGASVGAGPLSVPA
ncbi:MAG: RecB family exonuclease [Acidimicrobiales bacterium]